MAETQQNSRLLALPAKLRDKIWALSLTYDDVPIDILTAKGPSDALMYTSHQIQQETAVIELEASLEYWTAGKFEIHCDTPETLIEDRLSDFELRAIENLKIYGRKESYVFTGGVWTCTRLCRSPEASKVIATIPCPDGSIYDPRADGNTTVHVQAWCSFCTNTCSNRVCGKHSFVSIGPHGDAKKAQKDLGWTGLTRDELLGMLRWYDTAV